MEISRRVASLRSVADPPAATTVVLDSLRRIVRVLRESSRASEKVLGVTGAQLFVLKALSAADESSLNDVAARTRTHQSTVSVVVAGLVKRRLVRRRASLEDKRRVALTLTARGTALLARAPLAAQEKLVSALESLPPKERLSLARALSRLTEAMGLGAEPAPMFFEGGPARRGQKGRHGRA